MASLPSKEDFFRLQLEIADFELLEKNEECLICLEPYGSIVDTSISLLLALDSPPHVAIFIRGCGHKFGSYCLRDWLQNNETCPVCRKELSSTASNDNANTIDAAEGGSQTWATQTGPHPNEELAFPSNPFYDIINMLGQLEFVGTPNASQLRQQRQRYRDALREVIDPMTGLEFANVIEYCDQESDMDLQISSELSTSTIDFIDFLGQLEEGDDYLDRAKEWFIRYLLNYIGDDRYATWNV
ncbi:unnamed protein product [Periconia digitata]|uniref:RING-type domain-containing protein n=1 Tax=Periconia digitata TaxID=1303443 RepID=A0A9W4U8Y8_9PLEO|nr:unnamed protein product [Periconia digitata]